MRGKAALAAPTEGQPRKLVTHSARNGHLHTMDRHNGQIIGAKPYRHGPWRLERILRLG
jgi:glucose dehydrogenase